MCTLNLQAICSEGGRCGGTQRCRHGWASRLISCRDAARQGCLSCTAKRCSQYSRILPLPISGCFGRNVAMAKSFISAWLGSCDLSRFRTIRFSLQANVMPPLRCRGQHLSCMAYCFHTRPGNSFLHRT